MVSTRAHSTAVVRPPRRIDAYFAAATPPATHPGAGPSDALAGFCVPETRDTPESMPGTLGTPDDAPASTFNPSSSSDPGTALQPRSTRAVFRVSAASLSFPPSLGSASAPLPTPAPVLDSVLSVARLVGWNVDGGTLPLSSHATVGRAQDSPVTPAVAAVTDEEDDNDADMPPVPETPRRSEAKTKGMTKRTAIVCSDSESDSISYPSSAPVSVDRAVELGDDPNTPVGDIISVGDSPIRPAQTAITVRSSGSGKQAGKTSKTGDKPAAMTFKRGRAGSKSASLHSFFHQSATVAAVQKAAQVAGRPIKRARKPDLFALDPWHSPTTATVHVNAPIPVGPISEVMIAASLSRRVGASSGLSKYGADIADDWTPLESTDLAKTRDMNLDAPVAVASFAANVSSTLPRDAALWSEKYRNAGLDQLDAVNKAQVSELTEWLKPFYSKKKSLANIQEECDDCGTNDSDKDSDGDDDISFHFIRSEIDDTCGDQPSVENVVLITGPVGSGKSTIVQQAAARLKLATLEINASMCRTAKRVREVIGEALVTHRVQTVKAGASEKYSGSCDASGQGAGESSDKGGNAYDASSNDAQNSGCNTLIVFEEVDQLNPDERGFWTCIQELASSAGSRRPILITANSISAEMQAVFGDVGNVSKKGEIDLARVLAAGQYTPVLPDCPIGKYKHIRVPTPSSKAMYASLRAIAKKEKVPLSKFDFRILTGFFACGDLRSAINCMQYLSLGYSKADSDTLLASLVLDASCIGNAARSTKTFASAQQALWTGGLEKSCNYVPMSLTAAHFRAVSNLGKFKLRPKQLSSGGLNGGRDTLEIVDDDGDVNKKIENETANMKELTTLEAWADHLDIISLGGILITSSHDRFVETDPRLADEVCGLESGFAGPNGALQVTSALESQSIRVFGVVVDTDVSTTDLGSNSDAMAIFYAMSALTSSFGGQYLIAKPRALPVATARRQHVADMYPMLCTFAKNESVRLARVAAENRSAGTSTGRSMRSTRSNTTGCRYLAIGFTSDATALLIEDRIR
jgi:nucleoside-triphosphatase THEP1